MKIRHFVIVGLCSISAQALAQTTTNCTRDYFGNVTCQTNPQPGVNWNLLNNAPNAGDAFARGFREAQERAAVVAQQQALRRQAEQAERQARLNEYQAMQQRFREQDAAAVRNEAGKLVAAGDCASAETLALQAGNFSLAREIKSYCAK